VLASARLADTRRTSTPSSCSCHSLLVQAHAAMRRFGRQTDRRRTSRTRSFRQSFLLSYANRIGERLQAADHGIAASSGRW
jgi:hypothetical protein